MMRSHKQTHLRLLRHRDLNDPQSLQVAEPANDLFHDDRVHDEQVDSDLLDDGTALAKAEARNQALRALANREHSRGELTAKLERKGTLREIAIEVVEQLSCDGLQSDERFAESFVRSRVERGYGPILIRQELRQREVDDECVDEFLTRDHAFWAACASRAVEKRFRLPPDSRESWGRQARYLSRRGFSADLIYACLGDQR